MKTQLAFQTAQQIILTLKAEGWNDNNIARAIQRSQTTISRIRNGDIVDPGESIGIALRRLIQQQSLPDKSTATPEAA